MDKKLLKNLNRLGLQLVEPDEQFDANKTLADVVASADTRLWECFPVLLANAARDHAFDYDATATYLAKKGDKTNLRALLLLSLAMYEHYHLSFLWANNLKKNLSDREKDTLKTHKEALNRNTSLKVSDRLFDASRLKEMFQEYFRKETDNTRQLQMKHEELSMEYALSQLFSPKQKELFKKKTEGAPLNKTEREYYSRVVKKKVAALANPELHRLAQRLMEF